MASLVLRTLPRREVRSHLDELERVALLISAKSDDGDIIPAGTLGTVVAVWSGGGSYDVEFSEPFQGLATVPATAIAKV